MTLFNLMYGEWLDPAVQAELEQLVISLNEAWEVDHDGETGEHTSIDVDAITARNSNNILPITGSLKFLKGRILIDEPGNNSHIAGLRPDPITANVNNYNPPGGRFAFIIEMQSDADRSVTGLECYAQQKQIVILGNKGNYNITLEHDHASSLAANRFGLPGNLDIVLGSNEYIMLYYDVGAPIWRAVSYLG